MKTVRVFWMLVTALALGVGPVLAEAPASGSYTNTIDAAPVWDVSGNYDQDAFSGNFTMSQDAQGKITGGGDISFGEEGVSMDMNFTVNGSVKGANGVTTVVVKQVIKGSMLIEDMESAQSFAIKFNGSITLRMVVDQVNKQLTGTMTGRVCVSAKGFSQCMSMEELTGSPMIFDSPLGDADMDGSWDLVVDLENVENKTLLTAGTVVLSNGRTLQLVGKGKYQPTTDLSNVTLKGDKLTPSKGASLKAVADGMTFEVIGLTGKMLGQKIVLSPR